MGIRKNGLPFRQRYLLLKLSHHKLKHSVIKEKFRNLFEQVKKNRRRMVCGRGADPGMAAAS